ncbi:MAG: tetratricopeptide repeat protein [Pseudomonadota bacterium]
MELRTEPFLVGEWTVLPLKGELRSGEKTKSIEPKLVEVLYLLATHANQVVANKTIILEVWGEHYVGESPVANAVSRLRRALGCSGANPTYIMTKPGEGYGLFAPVQWPAVRAGTNAVVSSDAPGLMENVADAKQIPLSEQTQVDDPEQYLAFVCYARQANTETAEWLVDRLRQASGVRFRAPKFFFDLEDEGLPRGKILEEVLKPAIRASRYFLLCLSRDALASPFIREELDEFLRHTHQDLDRVIIAQVGEPGDDIGELQQALLKDCDGTNLRAFVDLTGDPSTWRGRTLRRRQHAVDRVLVTMLNAGNAGQLRTRRRATRAMTFIAVAVVLLGLVGIALHMQPPRPVTIAAVPLLSPTGQSEQLGRDLSRAILEQLHQVADVNVISDRVSFPRMNTGEDILTLAKNIRSDYIVDGTIEHGDQRITVTVTLVNTTKRQEGRVVESGRFTVNPEAFHTLGSQIAEAIAQWLADGALEERRPAQSPTSPTPLNPGPPQVTSAQAVQPYYAGLEYLRRTNEESNLRRAISFFSQALEIEPRYAAALAGSCEAHLRLFIVSGHRPDYNNAEALCNRALTLEPGLAEAKISIGALYRENDKLEESVLQLEAVRKQAPDNQDVSIELADTYFELGREVEAERLLRDALEVNPGYWATYSALGDLMFKLERYPEALKYFQWVSQLMPDSAVVYGDLGATRFLLEDYPAAKDALDKSISIEPLNFVLINRGLIAYYDHEFGDAASFYRSAIDAGEDAYWAYGLLAEALQQMGAPPDEVREVLERAVALAEDFLKIDPSDSYVLADLALYHARLGDFDRAGQLIDEARDIAPDNQEVHQRQATIWAVRGELVRMCESLREAVRLGFPYSSVKRDPEFEAHLSDACVLPP